MHADEAIQADRFGSLLEGRGFAYDPRDYHGPLLAYVSLIPAHLAGQTSYIQLSETTLRAVPAIAGILLSLAPLLFAPWLGRWAVLAAAGFAAGSPALAYYSRDYIPETLLALFTALFLAALGASVARPVLAWGAAGAAAALMFAAKETAVLAIASAAIAYIAAYRPGRRTVLVLLGTLALPPLLFFDAAVAYAGRAVSGGLHGRPWYYYLQLLIFGQGRFTEAAIALAAVAGFVLAFRSREPFARFVAGYALLLATLYSGIPYKTPWCVISILFALTLLAGIAAQAMVRRWPLPVLSLAVVVVAHLAWQAWVASVVESSHPRNQWAYAQTGTGVFTIRDRVAEFARDAAVPLDVYSNENLWPLPWYLRAYRNVRWYRAVPEGGRPARIILASPAMEAAVAQRIYEGPPPGEREMYMELFPAPVELRPAVEIRGWVAKSLWDRQPTHP